MKQKTIFIVIALIVILVGGYFIFRRQSRAPEVDSTQSGQIKPPVQQDALSPAPQQPASTPPITTTTPSPRFTDENDIQPPPAGVPKRVAVAYDGTAFDPPTITIKAGDTVVFRNNSQTDFRPASNPHPTHGDYPGFDAKQNIAPGESYEFTFTKVGQWSYHNHLNPSVGGTIKVTQ